MTDFSYDEMCEMWKEVKEKVIWGGIPTAFSGTWIAGPVLRGLDHKEVFTYLEEMDFEYGWE